MLVSVITNCWQIVDRFRSQAFYKVYPKLLNFEQKQRPIDIVQEMLTTLNDDPDLLKKVITGDKLWVYGFDIETKAKLIQWNRPEKPRAIKAHQVRSNVCVLITVFFDSKGVNSCHKVVRSIKNTILRLCADCAKAIRQKRTELGKNQSWILQHDNAPTHTLMPMREFLARFA